MKVYQKVTATESSILNLDILVDNLELGFLVAGGTGNNIGSALLNSGFVFSGSEGYIFDQSGRFVGGYEPNIPINLAVHTKTNDTYSYFIDNVLIANNVSGSTGFNYIEFDKNNESTLSIEYIYQ